VEAGYLVYPTQQNAKLQPWQHGLLATPLARPTMLPLLLPHLFLMLWRIC
jgi:hypothetical protein